MHHSIATKQGTQTVTLVGNLDETIGPELEKLAREIRASHLVFNCSGIVHINSAGCFQWHQFLTALRKVATFEFRYCPVTFVDYTNAVPDLIGGGQVVSFEAPMHCSGCNRSDTVLLQAVDALRTKSFGSHRCARCGEELRPEVGADDYLRFLTEP